jgi:ABC-type transport system substrate-binding protein
MNKRFALLSLMMFIVAIFALPALAQDDMMKAEAPSCDYGGIIKSIEAVDALTVKFTLCAPDGVFPLRVALSNFAIQSSEYLESTGGTGDLVTNPVGTGPYKLEAWNQGSEIVLTRFDEYHGDAAIEPTVIFRWNSEAAARLIELQSGNVDGIDNPAPSDFSVIAGDSALQLLPRQGQNIFYVGFNNTIAPFDNVNVRQAIAYAIDRQRIVDDYYPIGSEVATQFMPPSIPSGYTPEVAPLAYDPEMARQLLAESGLELPLEITLNYRDVVRGYLPTPGVVAEDIRAQLAEVGINVTIEVVESGTFLDRADLGELGFYLLGWGADYPDATNFLDYHFGAGSSLQFGDKFEDITSRLQAAAQVAGLEERNAIYAEVNELIRDYVPMIPIAHGSSAIAFKASAVGALASPLSNEVFSIVEDPDDDILIWMQNGEPAGLYCADESDGEALRVCEQINESLLGFAPGTTDLIPSLATEYSFNDDSTEFTFTLKDGVLFHDGSTLDANDVVLSYLVQWDAAHPLHVGRDGSFTYFSGIFGAFLNPPATEE